MEPRFPPVRGRNRLRAELENKILNSALVWLRVWGVWPLIIRAATRKG
jgi:hypothetical protein